MNKSVNIKIVTQGKNRKIKISYSDILPLIQREIDDVVYSKLLSYIVTPLANDIEYTFGYEYVQDDQENNKQQSKFEFTGYEEVSQILHIIEKLNSLCYTDEEEILKHESRGTQHEC